MNVDETVCFVCLCCFFCCCSCCHSSREPILLLLLDQPMSGNNRSRLHEILSRLLPCAFSRGGELTFLEGRVVQFVYIELESFSNWFQGTVQRIQLCLLYFPLLEFLNFW